MSISNFERLQTPRFDVSWKAGWEGEARRVVGACLRIPSVNEFLSKNVCFAAQVVTTFYTFLTSACLVCTGMCVCQSRAAGDRSHLGM